MTIFNKIIKREIPADIVFEDEICLAFRDIHPQAPTHILLIPKNEIPSMAEVRAEDQEILGYLLVKAAEIAVRQGLDDEGYRVVINTRAFGGQTVNHLHLHIMGGRPFSWPPG
ncbi:MAG: histidine triad nucleotide-binding protein [Bdellovibrionales bacterium]|nr:histidine triad nucleotide-binding protein [Bdellovibrionales bacterium]